MKPFIHAKQSVAKHKGYIDDYVDIHEFLDSSKAHVPDMRHRAILHSSFGIYIAQQIFGIWRTNSDNIDYSVRDICEEHIISDLGFIPTVQDYLEEMPFYDWLGGKSSKIKILRMVD
jgi:hypothetical protein